MDPLMVALVGFVALFVLMFLGMPIGFSMTLVGFAGWVYLVGLNGALNELRTVPYASVASYTLAVLPMFILMGEWAYSSGLADGAFTAAYKALGRLRGGLAISTVGTCAIFAACTGSSIAGAATMVKVAWPSMKKYNYNPGFALGAIAAGGTLGILIPPSNPMIIYAIMTGTSVGKLFIGGFVPGILLTAMLMGTIYGICKVRPDMGPAGERASLREVFTSSKNLWPGIFLAAVVLVGLWGGVFSPSEAGAIGAFVSLLILFIRKGFAISEIRSGLKGTLQTTAMVFVIVIGAMIFGDFMTLSGVPNVLAGALKSLSISATGLLVILMILYIILGGLMDTLAMMILTLPIVFPIITAFGIDPVFFGILLVINSEMALISPPIAMVVFVIAGMVEDVPMYAIFRGIVPFFITMAVCLALIIIFPDIALWLPNTMRK